MSAESAHLSTFGAETETETEAEIRSTSSSFYIYISGFASRNCKNALSLIKYDSKIFCGIEYPIHIQ